MKFFVFLIFSVFSEDDVGESECLLCDIVNGNSMELTPSQSCENLQILFLIISKFREFVRNLKCFYNIFKNLNILIFLDFSKLELCVQKSRKISKLLTKLLTKH